MVYYFTSNVVQPSAFIYVGKDKFESMDRLHTHSPTLKTVQSDLLYSRYADEHLIEHGLDKDVW